METTNKTLLEYHYELRIESLRDDPRVNYAKRLVAIEMLANMLGWKHTCSREEMDIKLADNVCHA